MPIVWLPMCGISGGIALSTDGAPFDEAYLAAMNGPMRHRGPDGAGIWLSEDRKVGLGHRRLAIIDPSPAGAQPMSDGSGVVWLTFNGEIYNHAALRRELEAKGHRFRTHHCDTEVIIYAYIEWGTDCVHRLRGMFAFALWDSSRRRLWLVRDRMGIKPLYYCINRGRLTFASEIKALLSDRTQPRGINEEAFFHFLSFLTTPAPDTLFKGIRKLPGGSMLLVQNGTLTERRYWDISDGAQPVARTDGEIAERLLAELRTTVQLHKISDVPTGMFLSGGVDSTTIAALSAAERTEPLRTFSIGYDRDYPSCRDELEHARYAAQSIGAEHHEIRLTAADLVNFLPRMIELQDEPIADPVCVPLHFVAQLARDHGVVVVQVGEGADELFCGYPSWMRMWRLQRLNDRLPRPGALNRLGLAALRGLGKQRSRPYDWLERASGGVPIFWGGAEAFGRCAKDELLSPRLQREFAGRSSWQAIAPIRDRYLRGAAEPSHLGWMTYLDLNLRLPELLLMRVDKMTMGSSVEARVPFLDHEFAAFAYGIPEAVKLRGGSLKAVLKRAVRGLIPDRIIDRPKQGFGVPIHEWLLDGLPDHYREVVEEFAVETDLLDPGAVRRLFADDRRPSSRWYVLNVALWWDRFIRRAEDLRAQNVPGLATASGARSLPALAAGTPM